MLSSDKNIETLVQLIEELKRHLELKEDYLKVDLVEKVVKLLTAFALAIIILLLTTAVLFYFSFAAVFWMAPATSIATAFAIVACVFLAILVLTFLFRKTWIEKPLVRLLAGILLENV